MPNEFTVVGEHREDRTHLLVLGIDGQYYGYFPETEDFVHVEPGDDWVLYQEREEVQPEGFALEMEQPG